MINQTYTQPGEAPMANDQAPQMMPNLPPDSSCNPLPMVQNQPKFKELPTVTPIQPNPTQLDASVVAPPHAQSTPQPVGDRSGPMANDQAPKIMSNLPSPVVQTQPQIKALPNVTPTQPTPAQLDTSVVAPPHAQSTPQPVGDRPSINISNKNTNKNQLSNQTKVNADPSRPNRFFVVFVVVIVCKDGGLFVVVLVYTIFVVAFTVPNVGAISKMHKYVSVTTCY